MAFNNTNGFSVPRINDHSEQNRNHVVAKQKLSNGKGGGGTGENRYDVHFKVLMIGNSGVGKTSMLRTLMGEPFNPGTISTIGIDLVKKIFIVDNHRIQLEIWDTAGQEQYHSIVALHFRAAKAFVIVYDVTDCASFEQIRKYWLRTIDQHMDEAVPVFFAANKVDLARQRKVSLEEGQELATQQCAHGHFETSSTSSKSITHLFQMVAESMVSTWGAPKRYYEVDSNGDMDTVGYSQKKFVNLKEKRRRPEKPKCCQPQ